MKFQTIKPSIADLEVECWVPEASRYAAIVCHPHSLHGGSMNNKVVTTVAKMLLGLSCVVVRFNFRGVGNSGGAFSEGIGEVDDVANVHQWLTDNYPDLPLILSGFSFGSYVSYRYAAKQLPALLISIAPPVENFDFTPIPQPNCPWIVVQGDVDEVVDAKQVYHWLNTLTEKPILLTLPDAGHFFHGKLIAMRDQLGPIVSDTLSNSSQS